ncbi:hypothetical protein NC651_025003 [Populus alba x Populus x berolinensis]|nr:hypothetical protein NC651_025003 [Populus alba x Populus x berolinensis]
MDDGCALLDFHITRSMACNSKNDNAINVNSQGDLQQTIRQQGERSTYLQHEHINLDGKKNPRKEKECPKHRHTQRDPEGTSTEIQ